MTLEEDDDLGVVLVDHDPTMAEVVLPFEMDLYSTTTTLDDNTCDTPTIHANTDRLSPPLGELEPTVSNQQRQCKKCVHFADDCGQSLASVRVMTEPSHCPPRVSWSAVIRQCWRAGAAAASDNTELLSMISEDDDSPESWKAPRCIWELESKQPAGECVKFRKALEQQKVALENVVARSDRGTMVGTVKVANLGFEKRVFIRYTADTWRSYSDQLATYQYSPSKAFDTFRFAVDLPVASGDNEVGELARLQRMINNPFTYSEL